MRVIGAAAHEAFLGLEPGIEVEILAEQAQLTSLPEMMALDGEDLRSHPEYQLKASLAEIARGQTALSKAKRWADIAVEIFFEEERGVDEPSGLGRDRFLESEYPSLFHYMTRIGAKSKRADSASSKSAMN